jgi:hypothetical protein
LIELVNDLPVPMIAGSEAPQLTAEMHVSGRRIEA